MGIHKLVYIGRIGYFCCCFVIDELLLLLLLLLFVIRSAEAVRCTKEYFNKMD